MKPTFIEVEFALALSIAGFLAVFLKRLKKKKSAVIEDDDAHWI